MKLKLTGMYFFKDIIYGKSYYHYNIYDTVLYAFKNMDNISNDILYKDAPENMNSVFEFLQREGMVSIEKLSVRITEKRKAFLYSGGYKRKLLNERITFLAIIVAAIASVTGVIIALLQL
jgi:hypothetical protein